MFMVGGFGYIVPVILFWFVGTAEVQSWNYEVVKPSDPIVVQESQETQEPQKKQHDEKCENGDESIEDTGTKL